MPAFQRNNNQLGCIVDQVNIHSKRTCTSPSSLKKQDVSTLNCILANIIMQIWFASTGNMKRQRPVLLCSWWLLGFYDSTRDKDDTTVGVGHSRRYCNTGYDQSQGRRPSTLKCIGSISKGDIEPNHPSEINPNSDSRSRSDGRSRRFVQYRVDQSPTISFYALIYYISE